MVRDGQGGVGGGENGGEVLEVNGFMMEKREEYGGIVVVCCS